MLEIPNYPSFVAAILVFQCVPGAGTIAILNATARNGVGAGLGAVLGTLLGDFVYMAAAVAGLAAVLKATPVLLAGLQWCGAAYLCWMGWQLLRAPVGGTGAALEQRKSGRVYLRQAFAVSLTNPKVILFFVAFFPLFLRPDSPAVTLAAMMAHVTVISLLYQAGLVLAGNAIARKLTAVPSVRRVATRLAGIAFIGFGVRLVTGNR